ncbi:ATP-binding cassette domain-containing protein, partial [Methylobacterium trifolii]
HLRGRRDTALSAGERMRVLLARALAVEAEILLADEPITALDPGQALDAMALLRRLARGGTGVVVVLHDLTLAARFCDRIVVLDRGCVAAEGAPAVALTDAVLRDVFDIEVVRGHADGDAYLVPWVRSPLPHAPPMERRR